jgi:hypothetical protein
VSLGKDAPISIAWMYEINDDLINKEAKPDFKPAKGESHIRSEDTVVLAINGINILVREKRKVGVEDWYYDEQELWPMEYLKGDKIIIGKTVIKKITQNSILFEFAIEFHARDRSKKEFDTEEIWIDREALDGNISRRRSK